MENVILIVVLLLILGGAIAYIIKTKKAGGPCIGCPAGGCSACSGTCKKETETEKSDAE